MCKVWGRTSPQENRKEIIQAGSGKNTQGGAPWVLVVEDLKSRATRTKEYVIKRKKMKERLGIEITEV